MYNVILHKDAEKALQKATPALRRRVATAIEAIAQDPLGHVQVKRLKGALSHLHRYRVGNFRIIYEVHREENIVRVVSITARGGAYK